MSGWPLRPTNLDFGITTQFPLLTCVSKKKENYRNYAENMVELTYIDRRKCRRIVPMRVLVRSVKNRHRMFVFTVMIPFALPPAMLRIFGFGLLEIINS